jgi:hypothetical protein
MNATKYIKACGVESRAWKAYYNMVGRAEKGHAGVTSESPVKLYVRAETLRLRARRITNGY